jgi:hypothetical protein
MLEAEFELLRQTLVAALSAPAVGRRSIERFTDVYARRRFSSMRNQLLATLELAIAAVRDRGEVRVADPVADARRLNLLEGLPGAAVAALTLREPRSTARGRNGATRPEHCRDGSAPHDRRETCHYRAERGSAHCISLT